MCSGNHIHSQTSAKHEDYEGQTKEFLDKHLEWNISLNICRTDINVTLQTLLKTEWYLNSLDHESFHLSGSGQLGFSLSYFDWNRMKWISLCCNYDK